MGFKYPKNIRFKCTKCGLCCGDTKTKTRHVLLLKPEVDRIAAHTKRAIQEFAKETDDNPPYSFEILKNALTGMCIFLKDNECTIYEQRPLICRFYPFELTTDEHGDFVFRETPECPAINNHASKTEKKLGAGFFAELLKTASSELGRAT